MNRVILDAALAAKLRSLHQPSDLCDTSGRLLGRFIPLTNPPETEIREPQVSEEELDRRERVPGGRPLSDILADLEKRS